MYRPGTAPVVEPQHKCMQMYYVLSGERCALSARTPTPTYIVLCTYRLRSITYPGNTDTGTLMCIQAADAAVQVSSRVRAGRGRAFHGPRPKKRFPGSSWLVRWGRIEKTVENPSPARTSGSQKERLMNHMNQPPGCRNEIAVLDSCYASMYHLQTQALGTANDSPVSLTNGA